MTALNSRVVSAARAERGPQANEPTFDFYYKIGDL